MRPRDLAKIGRMVLAHGQWQGRQIVPSDWVTESLRPHIGTGDGLHYGYQWWTGTVDWEGKKLAWSAGFGNGGQRLFVVPDLDLTVVITAGAYNDSQIRHTVIGVIVPVRHSRRAATTRLNSPGIIWFERVVLIGLDAGLPLTEPHRLGLKIPAFPGHA
jgi:CubicO group peptidase (beta-lactamase class C family)